MKITVNNKIQRFYLAGSTWMPGVGHEVKVGNYRFSAIPTSKVLLISEVTSGCKLYEIPMTFIIKAQTSTKDTTMRFLQEVGKHIEGIIEGMDTFDDRLQAMKEKAFERLGEIPDVEDVDESLLFEETDGEVH
jgi:hypothetical protein